jgi:endonuclease YncB( thermonuclease family)
MFKLYAFLSVSLFALAINAQSSSIFDISEAVRNAYRKPITTANDSKPTATPNATLNSAVSNLPVVSRTPIAKENPRDLYSESQFEIKERLAVPIRVTGKVLNVHDGDTLTLLGPNNFEYKVRFNGVDAPELKQEFGDKSRKSLAKMVEGKIATIEYDKIDKYGRFVCKVFVNGTDINLEQLKRGMAWHFKKYQDEQNPDDKTLYAEQELTAKDSKTGLWKQKTIEAPWEYRLRMKPPEIVATNSEGKIIKPERKYERGAKGGCYYINRNGNKTYVDKLKCETQK